MARFTLLEVHFDDAQFSAAAPFAGSESNEPAPTEPELPEIESEESGPSPVRLVLGLVAVVGLFVAARKLFASDSGSFDEAEELDSPLAAD